MLAENFSEQLSEAEQIRVEESEAYRKLWVDVGATVLLSYQIELRALGYHARASYDCFKGLSKSVYSV